LQGLADFGVRYVSRISLLVTIGRLNPAYWLQKLLCCMLHVSTSGLVP